MTAPPASVPDARAAGAPPAAPHALNPEECVEALDSDPQGLSSADAARRLARHGPNLLPSAPRRSALRRFAAQFDNVLIHVLLGAAALAGLLQHWVDAGAILAVVLVNAVIGHVQEGKAEAALAAVRSLLAPRAAALRDGRRVTIDAASLAPGDVVLLEAGDRVPADLRLLEAQGLAAEESLLTGESGSVEKDVAPVAAGEPLAERRSMLWSGTLVTRGVARGLVVATGPQAELGRIGGLIAAVEPLSTPLLVQMDRLARWISALVLAASALLLAYGYVAGQHDFRLVFMAVVGVAVAAIPEGLPAVMTITLAVGVQAMARRNAIVRRLPAIEAIGSVSVICTDKTGTLTRNEMVLVEVETPDGVFAVTGEGYAPAGAIAPAGDLTRLARAAALCNDAALREREGRWTVEGDPMEGAMLAFAAKVAPPVSARRRDAIPFDSRHRFMAVLSDAQGGVLHVKGAPERVLPMCGSICGELEQAQWRQRADAMASRGLRVLALAERPHEGERIDAPALEGGMTFLGLVGFMDPPRDEAIAAVAECRAAGVRVKMITGDHAGTAIAIASAIGLANPCRALTGLDLDRMDDAQLAREAVDVDVFARTSPEHKLRLVAALQGRGLVVAMTGDGVNDAPALKRADVGVAMGRKGSQAARDSADIVLADDNFASIVAAMREGRRVYDNLRKEIGWTLPTDAGESLVVILALLLGAALPVTPVMILWINLVTAVTLGLALAFDPASPDAMARPPRPRDEPILTSGLLWHIVFVGLLFVAAVHGLFAHALARGSSLELAQTMAMNMLVTLEIFHLFFIRNQDGRELGLRVLRATPMVWAVTIAVLAAQALVTWAPPFQALLGAQPLSAGDVALILAIGIVFFVSLESEKRLRARWRGRPRRG